MGAQCSPQQKAVAFWETWTTREAYPSVSYWCCLLVLSNYILWQRRKGKDGATHHSFSFPLFPTSEKAMTPHSSTLAWKIPWTEEPGRLQSMGSLRVGHSWATSLSLFTFMHWRRKWHPLQCSCRENPRDGEAWWAAVYGVSQSWTWLKWLSSSSILQ